MKSNCLLYSESACGDRRSLRPAQVRRAGNDWVRTGEAQPRYPVQSVVLVVTLR
jgi:hypothetical protein